MTTYYVSTTGNDSNAGTSTGAAFATIGKFGSVVADYDVCYVEEGTYDITLDTPNVSNGRLDLDATRGVTVEGYATTPGDKAGLATFDVGNGYVNTSYMPIFNGDSFYNELRAPSYFTNIRVIDSATTTTGGWSTSRLYTGFGTQGATVVTNCVAEGASGNGFTDNLQLINCVAKNCSSGFSFNRYSLNCVAYQCDKSFNGVRAVVGGVIIEPYGDECFMPQTNGLYSGCIGYSSVAVSPKDASPIVWFGRDSGCGQALITGSLFEGGTYLSGNDRTVGGNYEFTELQVQNCAIYNVPNADLGNLTSNHQNITTLTESPFLVPPTEDQVQLKNNSQELYDWSNVSLGVGPSTVQLPNQSTQLIITGKYDIQGSSLPDSTFFPFRFAAGGSFTTDPPTRHPIAENL